ncbi:MAG: FkbM family methyltransferase [Candidatus Shapirobacteria bacterium]|jgi:FkbM family methyltransferase
MNIKTTNLKGKKSVGKKYCRQFALNGESFLSYAQNAEDVVLHRAFRLKKEGFYVDIGAANDTINSVTKSFYLQGWNGINVEPAPDFFTSLSQNRPNDINLNIGISKLNQTIIFYDCQTVKEWSTFSPKVYRLHRKNGANFVKTPITVSPLKDVLAKYAVKPIDFLKIDVEGLETAVLESNDWQKFRPAIVLVESETPIKLKDFMAGVNYHYSFYDGLNYFFVSSETKNKYGKYLYSANVRDNYITPSQKLLADQSLVALANFQTQYGLLETELKKTQTAYQRLFDYQPILQQNYQTQYGLLETELKKTQTAYQKLLATFRLYQSSICYKLWLIAQKLAKIITFKN